MRKRQENPEIEIKLLLSVEEAAAALSLGKSLVYELVRRCEIESVKVGRARRIPLTALQRFVERQLIVAR